MALTIATLSAIGTLWAIGYTMGLFGYMPFNYESSIGLQHLDLAMGYRYAMSYGYAMGYWYTMSYRCAMGYRYAMWLLVHHGLLVCYGLSVCYGAVGTPWAIGMLSVRYRQSAKLLDYLGLRISKRQVVNGFQHLALGLAMPQRRCHNVATVALDSA